MATTESPEELRKRANEILKGVDQLIKAGKLDDALTQIGRAKSIDPNNAYIYAFEERIAFLKAEEQKKKGSEVTHKQIEDAARKRLDEERRRVEEERRRKEEEIKKRYEDERQRRITEARRQEEERRRIAEASGSTEPSAIGRRKIEEDSKRSFKEDFQKAEEENRRKLQASERTQQGAQAENPNDPHVIYRRVLMLAWADGALSKEEETQLATLRTSLTISPEEDSRLQREVQQDSFAQAFKLTWTSGLNARDRTSVIGELRKKFKISPEDQPKIESKVLAEIGPSHHQQTILIVEDEDAVLKLLARVLEDSGFAVRGFLTSDEAYSVLRESNGQPAPDLIVADINLESSTMGGFSFYEKVRQLSHLVNVPFVFLSGLTDEAMIRYSKALGADDYITKPFSDEMLLDTVKGKLRRYKQIQQGTLVAKS